MAVIVSPGGTVATVSDELAALMISKGWSDAGQVPAEPSEDTVGGPESDETDQVESDAGQVPAEPEKRKPGRPKKS